MDAFTGGCRCGEVRYTLAVAALPSAYACHCLDCQTWSGSAFSQQVVVREEALSARGPIVDYVFTSPSGSTSHQRICATCHARIWNTNSARSGLAIVRAGTLDRSEELACPVHIWVRRKQPWLVLPAAAACFVGAAPADVIRGLLAD